MFPPVPQLPPTPCGKYLFLVLNAKDFEIWGYFDIKDFEIWGYFDIKDFEIRGYFNIKDFEIWGFLCNFAPGLTS